MQIRQIVKRALQSFFLRAYQVVGRTGILSTGWGRNGFEWSYYAYKRWIEAGDFEVLHSLITPATTVIDVGANVGFFTQAFARWVTGGGRVIAIEPEAVNFQRLNRMLDRKRLASQVETIQAVAAEVNGTLTLEINPVHPADHKIGAQGIPVPAVTLDFLLAERGWPQVSLIKIDVQGAEARVLAGSDQILRRSHPALYVEVDDQALRRMNAEAQKVLGYLAGLGYHPHQLIKGRISPVLAAPEVLAMSCDGRYTDFLFLYG